MGSEEQNMNIEQRINLKFSGISSQTFETLLLIYGDNTTSSTRVFSGTKGSKRVTGWWLWERGTFNKQDWSERRSGEAGGVSWSSVDCLNDHKSFGYEKGQFFLKDYHQRFRHVECLRKNGAKTTEWWSEGAGRPSSIFKLNQSCFVEPSLVMRHWFLYLTQKSSARAVNKLSLFNSCFMRLFAYIL